MNGFTRTQQAAMIKAERQGPVVVIGKLTAAALVKSGHMQYVNMKPRPEKGVPVSLTTRGKSWTLRENRRNTYHD